MKIVVIGLAVAAALSGCVSRTYEKETVVEQKNPPAAVVVPQGATAPSSTTVVVPQSAPAPKSETTIVVPR
jgi:hypothetical protein